ncbi:hypothetical protein HYU21_04615 [Candidatus Woesearchaeota archaeon]|nr:hypothetical protein [Candidatus Woesearchaeota archaeon]
MNKIIQLCLMLVLLAVFSGSVMAVPDAIDDTASTQANTPKEIDVLFNDIDGSVDTYTLSILSAGPTSTNGGTVSIVFNSVLGRQVVMYYPKSGFTGTTDTFSYTIQTNEVVTPNTDSATVTVTLSGSSISSDEQDYNDLKDKLSRYDDDFYSFKRKYERAQDNNDLGELKRYKEKLQDLDDDLSTLQEKVDNLESDVEDRNTVDRDLLSNVRRLQDNVESLQDKISRVLDDNGRDLVAQWSDQTATGQTTVPRSTASSTTATEKPVKVVYEKLELPASTTATVPAPSNTAAQEDLQLSSTQQNYALTILISGVVIVLAVIIFLLASLLKR